MFENRPEQERKKIFWIIILSITAVIFIVWLILFVKGFILRPIKIANPNTNTNQTNFGEIRNELKSTLNDFKELNFKQKFSDIKDELGNLKNNQNQNQNENQAVNIKENINQPEASETTSINESLEDQKKLENLNNSNIPRLPVEN